MLQVLEGTSGLQVRLDKIASATSTLPIDRTCALGTTIPSVIVSCAVVPIVARRIVGISLARMWMEFWIRPLLALLPFAAGTIAVEYLWPPHGLILFIAQVATVLPVAGLGAWLVGFSAGERQQYTDAYLRPLRAVLARMW